MRQTKGITDTSKPSEISEEEDTMQQQKITESQIQSVLDRNRLQNLGLSKLTKKLGEQIQNKIADEATKQKDKNARLKVMTGKEIKKMKN